LTVIAVSALTFSYHKNISIPTGVYGKHIEINGTKIRIFQTGQGPDILFIHASIGNLEDFESVLPLLKNYRVTMFDRIGHGYSASPSGKANIENNALYTSALIKKLNLKDVTVVGHSYGGSIALKMALNKDSNIRSLVLLAPAGYSLSPTSKLEHMLATPVIGLGLLRLFQPFIAEQQLREKLLTSLIPNISILPKGFVDARIALWNNPGILFTRTQQTSVVTSELNEMQKHYENIDLSVTIFLGSEEQHNDITIGCHLLNDRLAESELIVIKGAGHYLQYKDPLIISNAIKKVASQPNS